MLGQGLQGGQVLHFEVVHRHVAVRDGLVTELLQETLEHVVYSDASQEVPLLDGLVQSFRDVSFITKREREGGKSLRYCGFTSKLTALYCNASPLSV